jgi:hypothetical protein
LRMPAQVRMNIPCCTLFWRCSLTSVPGESTQPLRTVCLWVQPEVRILTIDILAFSR